MIPQRVQIKGFLCYKDEQEIAFDGASLWMLAGLNGSGKSTIFDGLTYALFGHHRGGSQNALDLINKESEKASIDFEFTLGDQRYVAHRTIQRTKIGTARTTQQIYRCKADGTRDPIDGTHSRTGYDEWMGQHIGLSYDVFTSSVLLLQGKAEKLLDAGPKGRHEVLAGIVDLERYERLHLRAEEQRKDLKSTAERLQRQLEELPEITPLELAEALALIVKAETAQRQAQEEVERLQRLQVQADKWVDLQARLTLARQRWEQARKLCDDAAAIEQDVKRLAELRDVLPRMQTVVEQRGQIQKSELEAQELDKRRQEQEKQLAIQDSALSQTRQKLVSLRSLIATDETRSREVAAALRQAGTMLEKLREYERHEADLNTVLRDLARMPADPFGSLRKARETHDEVASLALGLPTLTRLHTQREQLREARRRQQSAARARDATRTRGEQLRVELDQLKPALDAASKASQEADAAVTAAKTLRDQERQQLDSLSRLDGAKECRLCGQKLTENHLRDEKIRRAKDLADAGQALHRAAETQSVARRTEQEMHERDAALDRQLQESREAFKEQRALAEQAQREVERLQEECGQNWSELAEPFRQRVAAALPADWLETTYPTYDDIGALRQQAGELNTARRRLEDAQNIFTEWNTFKGLETAARHNLARLEKELPADRQAIRTEHTRLEVEDKALDAALSTRRAEAETEQRELDRLGKERGQLDKQLAELKGKLATEEATRQLCRQTVNRAMKELPAPWQEVSERAGMSDLFRWRSEHDGLVDKQTDARGRQLQQARVGLEVIRQDLAVLEEEEQKFPTDARQEPEHVAGLLRVAQQYLNQRGDELSEARQRHRSLEDQRRVRQQLQEDKLRADKEFKDADLLAKLLGRDRLQLHLVRQAERQVVDHANAVLDRLSAGQLYLRLVGEAGGDGTAEKALQLEAHNRVTGERPINVAFLSGSQKFRVAVSLALGLGQYASRQHRPIESVIIDEGFGCLDKDGRQAMIQELLNLRGQLRCILLVSHQEEFAEAFADGYRFELTNGSTRVTRFQR
jgi:exonuclease SbcC